MTSLPFAATGLASTSDTPVAPFAGATHGGPAKLLRLEGGIALFAAVLAYREMGASWWLFAGLFLIPDLSMLGYLANGKVGAAVYNAGHTYLAPAALALFSWCQGMPQLFAPAVIWAAHIGFDRLLGYGLKYSVAFGATHLGWRGKREASRGVR